jgi:hypothetical protein
MTVHNDMTISPYNLKIQHYFHLQGRCNRVPLSRVASEAEDSATNYLVHTPPKIHIEIDLAKAYVRVLKCFISDEEVNEDVCAWIPDLGSSWAKESKYYRTNDLYWHMEMLMGRVLIERNEAHQEVVLELDDLQLQITLVDHKINLLAERISILHFYELDNPQP